MALIHSLEKNGNFLFKFRGQIPLVLFALSVPAIYFTDYQFIKNNQDLELILLITCSLVSFSGQVIRAIAIGTSNKHTSGRNTKEQVAEALNTRGIYSTVRHPLYLGNFFMWIGIVMYTFNVWFLLLVSLLFWIYYERIMFAEERFLERKFGEDYVNWSLLVPPFWPSLKNYVPGSISFSFKTILRREYSGVTATIIGFAFVAFLRDWFTSGEIHFKAVYGIVIGVGLLITIVFRTLKHHTRILFEEDRS
ncbi:MAG: isoprenylcysteine carboxylmethyltransferase family protein [Cryomorphaceae bacterium]|jgi:protein-S-isoprenylcysteine O-methyltransferase Ste14|nr:isoprenylcysteine carboxylmethyltransferase family protein [Cryomorphaceae bacterium]